MSPFEHVADIVNVEELRGMSGGGPNEPRTEGVIGAIVTFRAVRGMTAAWLQGVVNCHVARTTALGNADAEVRRSPLVPNGVDEATVTSTSGGFAVSIRSNQTSKARQIFTRAQRLVQRDETSASSD